MGAENKKAILEIIAMNGPLLKYDICKKLNLPQSLYGSISRRIDTLARKGYVAKAGKRTAKRENNQYKPCLA